MPGEHHNLLPLVVTAAEMAEMDRRTIEEIGVSGMVLMENAGREVVAVVREIVGEVRHKKIAIFCGKGNNGGDGYVVARYLSDAGARVACYLLGEHKDVKGDAATNLKALERLGVKVNEAKGAEHIKSARGAHLVVDGLLGTGVSGPLRGFIGDVVEEINAMQAPVVAIDLPTGVESDTGAVPGACVKATTTVTMACKKRGLVFSPGREHAGQIRVVDIGIPSRVMRESGVTCFEVTREYVKSVLPKRKRDTYKSKCGQILVLAGSAGMTGAATLSSAATLRVGAGLTILGIPRGLNPILEEKLTEVMTLPLPETSVQSLSYEGRTQIAEKLAWAHVLAVGPGLSTHEDSVKLMNCLVDKFDGPVVIDADGLNCLSQNPEKIAQARGELVLTPHPGELARLTGKSAKDIVKEPIEAARASAQKLNCILVLKGAPTVVAAPDGQVFINSSGNPGMATGGMGDVLTGVIAGLIGQGMSPLDGTIAGVYLHGLAGDLAAAEMGYAGLIAGDVLHHLPKTLKSFENE